MGRPDEENTHGLVRHPPGRARVVILWEGGYLAKEIPTDGELVIGRAVGTSLWVDHPSVSRQHAVVRPGPPLTIEDLGSANGTIVGGRRLGVGERAEVPPGVVAQLGIARLVVEAGSTSALDENPSAPTIESARRLVALAAPSTISVLLLGETGVGKEVFAEALHQQSPRASNELVRLNCAALPENLLESELFGYERGAFSGATVAKAGLIESAAGSTLFLDEIGDLPASVQVKLLRALERREVTRLGGLKSKIVDVRFVAATHKDLLQAIASGQFRQDLYFRLNGITITIPPLRQRVSEVLPLAYAFSAEARARLGRGPVQMTRDAEQKLLSHSWPGNVRELRNVMERAAVLCQTDDASAEHIMFDPTLPLPLSMPPPGSAAVEVARASRPDDAAGVPTPPSNPAVPVAPASGSLHDAVNALEHARIVDALARSGNNQTQAAKLLGISRRGLINRLEEYGFPRPRKR